MKTRSTNESQSQRSKYFTINIIKKDLNNSPNFLICVHLRSCHGQCNVCKLFTIDNNNVKTLESHHSPRYLLFTPYKGPGHCEILFGVPGSL